MVNAKLSSIKMPSFLLLLGLVFCLICCLLAQVKPALADSSYELLFSTPATSEQLRQLTTKLAPADSAKGEFTQYRTLKVLKQPLVSQGEFLFARSIGVVWQQTRPFSTTLILKDQQLIQIDSEGNVQINDAGGAGTAGAVSDILPTLLNALLSGDLATLENHFSLSLSEPEHAGTFQWQLGLIPLDPIVLKAMPKIVLEGQKNIHTLVLFSDSGDTSRIEFNAIDETPLTSEELARFTPPTLISDSLPAGPEL